MTLTGRAAAERPDIDALTVTPAAVVAHKLIPAGSKRRPTFYRYTTGPAQRLGTVDRETGAYRAAAVNMSEDERRGLRLRRNGQLRRKGAAR